MSSYRAKNRVRNLKIARESEKRIKTLQAENNANLELRKISSLALSGVYPNPLSVPLR